jgi:DNA-directed RNA polymerase specialized sigma24 family protein
LTTSKEDFDNLLLWFHSDRDTAAHRYESIRSGLIRIFISKGFTDAEALADETFDRVTRRLPEIQPDYVGDPARYCIAVARNIVFEERRRKEFSTEVLPEPYPLERKESDLHDCLVDCLTLLPSDKRQLILDYHVYQGKAKIENHRKMAAELKITEGALRIRAHHMRARLEKCVLQCVTGRTTKQKPVQLT